jgi:hypothetical protein
VKPVRLCGGGTGFSRATFGLILHEIEPQRITGDRQVEWSVNGTFVGRNTVYKHFFAHEGANDEPVSRVPLDFAMFLSDARTIERELAVWSGSDAKTFAAPTCEMEDTPVHLDLECR